MARNGSKWDIPLLNQSPSMNQPFSTELWNAEFRRYFKKEIEFRRQRNVWELRKSVNAK